MTGTHWWPKHLVRCRCKCIDIHQQGRAVGGATILRRTGEGGLDSPGWREPRLGVRIFGVRPRARHRPETKRSKVKKEENQMPKAKAEAKCLLQYQKDLLNWVFFKSSFLVSLIFLA